MEKVLIIEPNSRLLREIINHLESKGYEVVGIQDGATGVQKTLTFLPDIIVCNSDAPELNGYEVFNTLQQINSTAVIPFIFIKNKYSDERIKALMELGIDDYIVKPFALNDLSEKIITRLEKQKKIISSTDEKFKNLIELFDEGIFIYEDEKLTFVNSQFCSSIGYPVKDLMGMNLVNLIYKEDIQLVLEKISRCLRGIYKKFQVDFRAIKRNQGHVSLRMSGTLFQFKGKKSIIGTIAMPEENKPSMNSMHAYSDVQITEREKDILVCICKEMSNVEISEALKISVRTVEGHRSNLLSKTNCKNSVGLALYAVRNAIYTFKE